MRIRLVVVGKPRDVPLAAVIGEYERRAARYWPLEVHEVRAARGAEDRSADGRGREGERLLERATGQIVACDETGSSMTSAAFAAWLQQRREAAADVSFVIGGAYGLAPAVRARADRLLTLAPWTLPHELARLVLAEQLYRAGTIVRGEPYHK
ncbi:MAG TPA: 23S rRNA (pseudouridine(1915)-N(3))-methyltransferase RlmH [Gemmatimonadaceae bacterium]|nr:23S rRNA (pseudouridine(1915)-N(3))-methyltransferase RlmH [Gemmatimonadaceae bacterium]